MIEASRISCDGIRDRYVDAVAIVCGDDVSAPSAPLQGIGKRNGRYDANLPTAYRRIRVSAFGGGRIFKGADSVRFAGECSPRKLRETAAADLSFGRRSPVVGYTPGTATTVDDGKPVFDKPETPTLSPER